jgi:6-pyruvoyltetrahydropterin/6-carboxytetrahydropterin synthase
MIHVSKHVEFDTAHRVRSHSGVCRHLHGHRYRVTITVGAHVIPGSGMVQDFGILGHVLRAKIHSVLDHRTVLAADDPLGDVIERADPEERVVRLTRSGALGPEGAPPTAENLAMFCLEQIGVDGRIDLASVVSIEVRETPTSSAILYVSGPNAGPAAITIRTPS